jgi:hypothetical protein
MKVAFVIPWYGDIPGGAEDACKRTAENLKKNVIHYSKCFSILAFNEQQSIKAVKSKDFGKENICIERPSCR